MRLTILMSNIAVVPCFQKPWALTSDLDYAGTTTCPDQPTNMASLFTILPTVSAPPSASPTSWRAPAPILPPCTFLLFILGSYVISLVTTTWAPRAPHSFAESSCRVRTRPPFGQDRACYIKRFLPQPSQVAGMSWGINPPQIWADAPGHIRDLWRLH